MVDHEQDPLVVNEEEVPDQEALSRVGAIEQQLRVMKDILVMGEIPYTPATPPTARWLIHARGGVLYATDDTSKHHILSHAIEVSPASDTSAGSQTLTTSAVAIGGMSLSLENGTYVVMSLIPIKITTPGTG